MRAKIVGPLTAEHEEILSPEAIRFLIELHREFEPRRSDLLRARADRQKHFDQGEKPDFLVETREIREGTWTVAHAPEDLQERQVEITGPADKKMMIHALNSGASVFMADFEDALSPTWKNLLDGQRNCRDAVRRTLAFESPDGKHYALNAGDLATLVMRPRGWHLEEERIRLESAPLSASLFDFGLYFFHNAKTLLAGGTGPYFYLPKLEGHLEARLWHDVFRFSEKSLAVPSGSIRATVLIETIPAAFEMDEILHELRAYASGLNAGRWDYIFSIIKKFSCDKSLVFPDRAAITMSTPFMRAYCQLLVKTCHARGAHAIGGMAAYVPSRRDPTANERAIKKVREDKEREAGDGFDGTWVAHPDLVPIAREIFSKRLGRKSHQKDVHRRDFTTTARELLDFRVSGDITDSGLRANVGVALQYLDFWLSGTGAVTIQNLMEDVATAEIARSELWQWLHREKLSKERFREVCSEESARLRAISPGHLSEAQAVLDALVTSRQFPEFLTIAARHFLSREEQAA